MRCFLGMFCLLAFMTGHAQPHFSLIKKYEESELLNGLKTEKSDSGRATIYYLLSLKKSLVSEKEGVPDLLKAKALLKNNPFLLDIYPFYEAYTIWYADAERSKALFLKADQNLKKYKTKEAFYLRAKCWRNMALLHQDKQDYIGFINAMLTAIPLAKTSKDSAFTGLIYSDVANVFTQQKQYEKAAENYEEGLVFLRGKDVNYLDLANVLSTSARGYLLSKKEDTYPLAKKLLEEEAVLLKDKPLTIEKAEYFLGEGMYYHAMKQYDKSIQSFDKGVALMNQIKQTPHDTNYINYSMNAIKYQKYFSYRDKKDYRSAIPVLLEYLDETPSIRTENKLRVYFDISETYAALGNKPKAYDWLKMYSTVNDSLNDINLKEKVAEMDIKFKTAEKEKQIAVLEAEKKEAILKQKNATLTNWLLGIGCLLFLTIGAASYSSYKKNKKIAAQQIQEIKSQQEIELAQALLEGEDRERQRMARDLHDGLGGMLAGVKINLSRQAKMENQNLDVVINQIDQSVTELRRIARNMMPESLVRFGLETSLRDLCESLSYGETSTRFEAIDIKNNMELSTQIVVYRIIQEALSNAIRHADAKNILLQCSQNNNTFFITLEDDGKGFDVTDLQNKKGIGLSNIENRVKYLQGKLEIVSQPNEGTTINIEVNVAA